MEEEQREAQLFTLEAPNIRVVHLYTSGGHNFFGHHGQSAGQHTLIEHQEIYCEAGRGINGDRFFLITKTTIAAKSLFSPWKYLKKFAGN